MHHVKLPNNIQERVNRYYDVIWKKFKGIQDSVMLTQIPENLKSDVLFEILQELLLK